jgi:pimeloyl-ACP methyl ester carboxylesterase
MNASLPLVLVPGLNCSARVFADVLPELWRHGSVAIANHTRGDRLSAIAERILDDAPARFALAGFSLGGYIALEIWRQARERVARLALLDTSARPETPALTEARQERAALVRAGRFREAAEHYLPQLFHPSRAGDAALRATYLRMAEDCGPDVFLRHIEAIIARPDSRPDLPAIGCPTLVLVGDSDGITPPAHAREMADAIPGARLVVVPECGHMSPMERPEAVARALGEWLRA